MSAMVPAAKSKSQFFDALPKENMVVVVTFLGGVDRDNLRCASKTLRKETDEAIKSALLIYDIPK